MIKVYTGHPNQGDPFADCPITPDLSQFQSKPLVGGRQQNSQTGGSQVPDATENFRKTINPQQSGNGGGGKRVGVNQPAYESLLSAVEGTVNSMAAQNGMEEPAGAIDVPTMKKIWQTYDHVTTLMNYVMSLALDDVGRFRQVKKNQVELDQSYAGKES